MVLSLKLFTLKNQGVPKEICKLIISLFQKNQNFFDLGQDEYKINLKIFNL